MPPFDDFYGGDGDLRNRHTRPSRRQPTNTGPFGDLTSTQFTPELERIGTQLPEIEALLLNRLQSPIDYSQFSGALEQFAGSVSDQLFGAGGAVEQATRSAMEQSVGTGFGPTSGGFDRARMNIFSGARDQLTNAIGTQAVNIAQMASGQRSADINALLGFTGMQGARRDELARDLFGIQQTGITNQMDRETMALNRRMVEQALRQGQGSAIGGAARGALSGAATGATIGSVIPGLGTGIGAGIGGILGIIGGIG